MRPDAELYILKAGSCPVPRPQPLTKRRLEITERTLIENASLASRNITDIRGMGVRVALDDFGTGHSSLGHLHLYAFDKVKLDRSFVEGLLHNPRSEAVASAVLQLGHTLGMAVCAEGVEIASQLEFLRAERCDMVQGYFTGRPGPGPLMQASCCTADRARSYPKRFLPGPCLTLSAR